MAKKIVWNNHHIIYASPQQKEVVRRIRKGVHCAVTMLRRFNYLTPQEIDTVKIELELKKKYDENK